MKIPFDFTIKFTDHNLYQKMMGNRCAFSEKPNILMILMVSIVVVGIIIQDWLTGEK